jgi:predicted ester cyclase
MTVAENKHIVRRHLTEGVSQHTPEVWDEIMHPDFVMHVGLVQDLVRGRDSYKQVVEMFWTAFPDMRIEVFRVLGEDDLVAAHYVERGTQEYAFAGHASKGNSYEKNGLAIYRIDNQRMVEAWVQEDDRGFAKTLMWDDFNYG